MDGPDLDRTVEPSFSCDLRPSAFISPLQPRSRSPFGNQVLHKDPTMDKYRYFKQSFEGGGSSLADVSFSSNVPPLLATPAELSLLEPRSHHDGQPGATFPVDLPLPGSGPDAFGPSATNLGHGGEPPSKHRRTVSSPNVWTDAKQWDMQHPLDAPPSTRHVAQPTGSHGGALPLTSWDPMQTTSLTPAMPNLHIKPGVPSAPIPIGIAGSCSSTVNTPLANSPLHSNVPSGTCSPVGRVSAPDLTGLHNAISTSLPAAVHAGFASVPSSPTIHQQATGGLSMPSHSTANSSGAAAEGNSGNKNTVTSGSTAVPTTVVQELLQEVPPELQPVVLAKVSQRGRGGRAPAADPRTDPNIDPRKARRILANRQSAARSKLKQKMLLETLRVNKEVLAVQQGSVQEEVARLNALVAQLQARNKQLEDALQALTLQQRINTASAGMIPSMQGWSQPLMAHTLTGGGLLPNMPGLVQAAAPAGPPTTNPMLGDGLAGLPLTAGSPHTSHSMQGALSGQGVSPSPGHGTSTAEDEGDLAGWWKEPLRDMEVGI